MIHETAEDSSQELEAQRTGRRAATPAPSTGGVTRPLTRRATASARVRSWFDLPEVAIPLRGEPLSLDQTLACGQAFRWRMVGEGIWEGIAGGRIWRLRIDDDKLFARAAPHASGSDVVCFLSGYFALDLSVREIQRAIAHAHPMASDAVARFSGLRILRQDPLETLLTFTIATATNVPRVTRSVAALCQRFGKPIAIVDGLEYRDFPTPSAIISAPFGELFGPCNLAYRARSIQTVAHAIQNHPPDWLDNLATLPYPDAHRTLDALPFLGPKVSDCICLFGLGLSEAVPVDVHVWAIAHELFGEDIPTRTLTQKTYQRIGDRFRELFSPWAGWAQQYLFCARRAIPINERFRPELRDCVEKGSS
jgi:N-glycosylase/DNA lyase